MRLEVVQGGEVVQGEFLGLGKQPGAKKNCSEGSCVHEASLLRANRGSKG